MTSLSTSFERIRRSHAELGTRRFVLLNLFILSWLGLFFYLAVTARWSDGCGIDGVVKTYRCSFGLLSGNATELGLFAWLWLTPLMLVAFIAAKARKLRAKRRGR